MINLLILVVLILVAWPLIKSLNKEATLEEARTIGLQAASSYIQNPILLEDYLKAKRIPREELDALIEQEKIPSYRWRQYTYIENRELIFSK